MEYNIGDKVVIIDDGFGYPDYRDWVGDFALNYISQYNDLRKNLSATKGLIGTVVVKQEHSRLNDKMLYLVELDKGCVLIEKDGIELAATKISETVFNIGDRVRVIDSGSAYPAYYSWINKHVCGYVSNQSHFDACEGSVGIIVEKQRHSETNSAMLYFIRMEDGYTLIGERGIELVTTEPSESEVDFSKDDLKTGMSVKLRDGTILLVIKDSIGGQGDFLYGEDILLGDETGKAISLSRYNDSLENTLGYARFRYHDIMEVRSPITIADIFEDYSYYDFDVKWRRVEETDYVTGYIFGDSAEHTWRANGIECSNGNVVEVKHEGRYRLAEVSGTLTLDCAETANDTVDRYVSKKVQVRGIV